LKEEMWKVGGEKTKKTREQTTKAEEKLKSIYITKYGL